MSDLSISASEHGQLRVFALSNQLAMEITHTGVLDQLQQALGLDSLGVQDVQIVQISALEDLGLNGLLRDGYAITLNAQEAATIDALTGEVALIRSAAFAAPTSLTLNGEAELIATFTEQSAPAAKFSPLVSDATKGVLGGPEGTKPRRGFGARLALIAMLALMASLAWVFLFYIGF